MVVPTILVSTIGHRSARYGAAVEPLYHLALAADWAEGTAAGRYTASTRGRSLDEEGFIHCSFAHQVIATADRFYGDTDDVVLLRIDAHRLSGPVVVEDLFGAGEAFPHIYGPIDLGAVVGATPWPRPRSWPLTP